MKTVEIDLGARAYQVRIGHGLLSMADEIVPWVEGKQVCIVSDEVVAPLYLDRLRDALPGKQVVSISLAPGEPGKSLDGAARIFDFLLSAPCDREVTVIALGGGVVGDIAGFAAACYQRGVPYIQAPTTLLAQVDSSVGGKTGVNHPLGKNMIGAFHQPRRVLADTATLATLERRQFAAGMAEVIKYGVINDRDFFAWLEDNIAAAMARDSETVERMIERACINKAKIVEQDERESGTRALLNLGHTFGHALEAECGYGGDLLHGEAVAIGTVLAFDLSAALGLCPAEDASRVRRHFTDVGLPTGLDALGPRRWDAATLVGHMGHDKKVRDGRINFVLVRGIGQAFLTDDVGTDDVLRHLEGAIAA